MSKADDPGISVSPCNRKSRRGRPPGRVPGSLRDRAERLGRHVVGSASTLHRALRIAAMDQAATDILSKAGCAAGVDFRAVWKAADEARFRAWLSEGRDLLDPELWREKQIEAAKTHVAAKLAKRKRGRP